MKKRGRILLLLCALLLAATAAAQSRVHRFYEDNYGIEERCYSMGETVPFGENTVDKSVTMEGCSICIERAEILTGGQFLDRVGQTEDTLAALLGRDVSSLRSARLCFLTAVVSNGSGGDRSFDPASFTLAGENYDVALESAYTIIANPFLLNAHRDGLSGPWGGMGQTGIHLDPGQEAEIYIVYGFSKTDLSARKWDRLDREPLWLEVTFSPVAKYIVLDISCAAR